MEESLVRWNPRVEEGRLASRIFRVTLLTGLLRAPGFAEAATYFTCHL
jgi:hypothetical protein